MHATELIQTNPGGACQSMHKSRFEALTTAVEATLAGRCVSVTGLGRFSPRKVTEKPAIQQVGRLVGNAHLQSEMPRVYGAMAQWILGTERRPLVRMDWSLVSQDESFHVRGASVPAGGRGKTRYEEVHPQADYGKRSVQTAFLRNLAAVIPAHCTPILVTDAGFKTVLQGAERDACSAPVGGGPWMVLINPWFRAVEALGWDWIGRVRGRVQMTRPDEDNWLNAKLLGHLLETDARTYMGRFLLAKSDPLDCAVYGLRKPPQGRVDKTKQGARS